MKEWMGYRVTSEYGWRSDPITGKESFHTGIDLVKEHKSPIKSFTGGKVIHARMGERYTGFGGYGIVVAVKDRRGALHCYCHMNSVEVAEGDLVKAGDVVGYQGSTGRSTGSHLHYEVRLKSNPSYGWGTHTDPVKYLEDYEEENKYILSKTDAEKLIILLQANFKLIEDTSAATPAEKEIHRLANEVRKAAGMEVR